jgi:cellulose synthase (UDP-forming)
VVKVDGVPGELVDIGVGGAAVRLPIESSPTIGLVDVELPGARAIKMLIVRIRHESTQHEVASLQAVSGDWHAIQAMSVWLFHTPAGAVPALPPGVPAAALT